jgi:hypothetical protein
MSEFLGLVFCMGGVLLLAVFWLAATDRVTAPFTIYHVETTTLRHNEANLNLDDDGLRVNYMAESVTHRRPVEDMLYIQDGSSGRSLKRRD